MTDPQDIDVCAHCGTPINCDEACLRGQAQLLQKYEEAILKARDNEDERMSDDLFTSFTNMQQQSKKLRG